MEFRARRAPRVSRVDWRCGQSSLNPYDKAYENPPLWEKLLCRNLPVSRRRIKVAIKKNGLVTEDGLALDPQPPPSPLPTIVWESQPVDLFWNFALMLNKRLDTLTARHDAEHETVMADIWDAPLVEELRTVGRLDMDACGLLLFTTDGDAIHRLTHPKNKVQRTYQVALARPYQPDHPVESPPAIRLKDGHAPAIVRMGRIDTGALHPQFSTPKEAQAFATLTIEGAPITPSNGSSRPRATMSCACAGQAMVP